ncbi:MAG: hypothetical protein H7Y42_12675 [Chitinophagaceae bacterium]|nr:hypothetical protein [Chitinophagaceae bacterium]
MKTMNNPRLIALAFAAALSVAFTSPALANDDKKVIPVELNFIGNLQSQPLFHMVFTSTEETQYTIVVRDQFGNVLYKDVVKGKNITKKFLLNTEELGDAELKFEVTGRNNEKPVVFQINKQTRSVEDVFVSKKN